jgi:hypothetical protein
MICAERAAFKSGKLGKGKASAVPPYSSLVVTINHNGRWSRRSHLPGILALQTIERRWF